MTNLVDINIGGLALQAHFKAHRVQVFLQYMQRKDMRNACGGLCHKARKEYSQLQSKSQLMKASLVLGNVYTRLHHSETTQLHTTE